MMTNHKSCQSHCCERHGCKYGHEDCPVATQKLEQDGPCFLCPSFPEIKEELAHWEEEYAFWAKLNKRRSDQLLSEHRAKLKEQKEKKDVR